MKKTLILLSLVLATVASADIIRLSHVSTKTVTGEQAETLYNSLNSPELPGDSLRTLSSYYKVEREENGLKQIICEKTVQRIPPKPASFRCTIQKSTNGQPVPEFHVPRRLG